MLLQLRYRDGISEGVTFALEESTVQEQLQAQETVSAELEGGRGLDAIREDKGQKSGPGAEAQQGERGVGRQIQGAGTGGCCPPENFQKGSAMIWDF